MPSALVTGASRGLGLEFVRQLSATHRVLATCRRPDDADALRATVEAAGRRSQLLALDVTDPDSIAECARSVAAEGSTIDLLLHCAGVWDVDGSASSGPLETLRPQALLEVLRVNAVAILDVTRAMVDRLARDGLVVSLSSGLGSLTRDVPRVNYGYALSKAALNMATRYLAEELAPVRVIALDPGWVRTDLGGPDARLSVEESVRQLRRVLGALGNETGCFLNRHGEMVPW